MRFKIQLQVSAFILILHCSCIFANPNNLTDTNDENKNSTTIFYENAVQTFDDANSEIQTENVTIKSLNVEVTKEGTKISWAKLNGTEQYKIEVSVKSTDKDLTLITVETKETEYLFTNLFICSKFYITVSSVTPIDPNIMYQTTLGPSGNITKALEVVNKNITGAEITWEAIDGAQSYEIIVSEIGKEEANLMHFNIKTNETSYVLTNLTACSSYNVTVVSIAKICLSIKYHGVVETLDAVTGPISRLRVISKKEIDETNVSFNVTWMAPTINLKCLSHYLLTVYNNITNEVRPNIAVHDTFYEVNNLDYCVPYTFKVTAVNKQEEESQPPLFRPEEKYYPSFDTAPPTNLTTEIVTVNGEKSLNVSWSYPILFKFCINKFEVKLTNKQMEKPIIKNTTNNYFLFTNIYQLDFCRLYDIEVKQINELSGGSLVYSDSANAVYKLQLAPPVGSNDQAWSTKDSITIHWTISNDLNCDNLKLKTSCNSTKILGHGYEQKNNKTEHQIVPQVDSFNVTVANLSSYTEYQCTAKIVTEDGQSETSEMINVVTKEDVSMYTNKSNPPTFKILSEGSIELRWSEPDYLPGKIVGYKIVVIWTPLYRDPTYCRNNYTDVYKVQDNKTSMSLPYHPYTNHSIQVMPQTGAGWGNFSKSVNFTAVAAKPGPVKNIFLDIQNSHNDSEVKAVLTWNLPCEINGKLESFNISVSGELDNKTHTLNKTVNVPENGNEDDTYSYDFSEDLKAEYTYTFVVAAKVHGVDSLGSAANYVKDFPAGIPKRPLDKDLFHLSIEHSKRTKESATVMLPLFMDTTNGRIISYSIIVAEQNYNPETLSKPPYSRPSTWFESMSNDFKLPYQANDEKWDYSKQDMKKIGNITYIVYVIGDEPQCLEISMQTQGQEYCNGPLKPDTFYEVRIRAFTKGGYADSPSFLIKTKSVYNIGVIIGSVFGIILFGVVTTVALLLRNKNITGVLQRFLNSSIRGSPVPAPFTRKKFIAHCQQLAENPGKLSNEFQLLQTLSTDLMMPTNTACLQSNRKKNRYTDILPYDFSRVKLNTIENDPNSDYINASFIQGVTNEDEYIACQGPKEETVYDFWRMIDQYEIKIIVMLTQFTEKGKEKCHQYFPNMGENFSYENMSIRCISKLDFHTYIQRTLILEKDNNRRSIIHLQFKDWPDHDVPEDFDPVINFCQKMRKQINATKGLVVVHCSAGIGRTGTLLAIDILLQQIKDCKKLDVFGTVYRLRRYRLNMVQRESQYAYIYNCIRQVLKNPYSLKSYKAPPVFTTDSNRSKVVEQAPAELTHSDETLTNFSTSAESVKPLCDSFSSTPVIQRNDSQSHGLRFCKSVNAIYAKLNSISQLGSSTFAIYELDSSSMSSEKMDSLHGSTDSLYENVTPLLRSKSAQEVTEVQKATHDWLERDTSV